MIAVSTMAAVLYSLKTTLVQFDKESMPLKQAFEDEKHKNMLGEEFSFYNRKGLDEVLEKSRLEKVEKSVITNNLVNVKHTNLYYMPPSAKTDLELEESLDEHFIHMFFSGMKHFKSLNFIDGINGTGEISETLLRNSDLIVVNLYQGMDGIEEILENQLVREKGIFIVGRYDQHSRETLQNMRRKYNIAREAIGIIPYNIHFHDAVLDGRIVPFITKGIFAKKTDMDYDFIMELYHTTNMILRRAGYEGI